MNHKISWDYIIFWSSILTFLVISHKANGILTDSNDLHCTHIQCPTKCPADSYLKSTLDDEEDDFEDYEDELLGHDSHIEELGHFEDLPAELELHDIHTPQHILKERQKREVFFQEDIERCCDDQKCVCNKCDDVPKCAEQHVAVEVHEGQGLPGNCCSIYKCVKKQECQLGVKQAWWTSKCTKCSCFGENEFCLQICPEEEMIRNCYSEYLQKPMLNGAFWKEGSCTTCSCEQGDRRCLTPVCPKLDCKNTVKFEDECCPKCLDDETNERPEIVHNRVDEGSEDMGEEYVTESTTDGDVLIQLTEENKSTVLLDNNNSEEVKVSIVNESQTASPLLKVEEATTIAMDAIVIEEISSTLIPETEELNKESSSPITGEIEDPNKETVFINETTTSEPFKDLEISSSTSLNQQISSSPATSTSNKAPKSAELELDSSLDAKTTSTENPLTTLELGEESSTTVSSSSTTTQEPTEEPKPIEILEQDLSTTTEAEQTSSISTVINTTTETLEELKEETTPTRDSLLTLKEETTSTPDSLITVTITPAISNEESTTLDVGIVSTLASSMVYPAAVTTSKALESSSETSEVSTTTPDPKNTENTLSVFSTSTATQSPSNSKSTTQTSSFSMVPEATSSIPTTSNSPKATTTEAPIQTYSVLSTSSQTPTTTSSSTTSTTSTTSSPFFATSVYSTSTSSASNPSTTTAPEPLKPLYQSYGDLYNEERSAGNQNQMRIIFDEIDYVVMIALFIGSLLCISLGLIIRHTKNRKKMYSSIPNSETSLSQESTNTVMTV